MSQRLNKKERAVIKSYKKHLIAEATRILNRSNLQGGDKQVMDDILLKIMEQHRGDYNRQYNQLRAIEMQLFGLHTHYCSFDHSMAHDNSLNN